MDYYLSLLARNNGVIQVIEAALYYKKYWALHNEIAKVRVMADTSEVFKVVKIKT